MKQYDKFNEQAVEVARLSAKIIQRYSHNQIDTEHLLLALLEQPDRAIPKNLEKLNVNSVILAERLDAILRNIPKSTVVGGGSDQIFITPKVKRIIDRAHELSQLTKDELISSEHLFLSILQEKNTPTSRLLKMAGLTFEKVFATIVDSKIGIQLEKNATSGMQSTKNNNVFIVHGHDDAMKETVARTIEKLGLSPIVLHEKPNSDEPKPKRESRTRCGLPEARETGAARGASQRRLSLIMIVAR